ncbi:MAG: hypothetical protein ACOVSW_17965 [Candidatus Kapaibacteriota bacterium]
MNGTSSNSPSEALVSQFIARAMELQPDTELLKVLKSRTYRIGTANVLVRAASDNNKRFFFGLNYLTAEEIANLDNPYIAFICGSIERVIIIPANVFFKYLPQISHDRNGEYKINIDRELNIVLSGKKNRLDCSKYINKWELLEKSSPSKKVVTSTVEDSLHSILQARLIEVGNIRGYETYSPDKSKKFNGKRLDELTTLQQCPDLQFADYDLLKQIDVLWFTKRENKLIPQKAFEVEISTGIWSGVGRMATLIDYSNVGLYIISNDARKYSRVMSSFLDYKERYKFITNDLIGDLYAAELNLKDLRIQIGL